MNQSVARSLKDRTAQLWEDNYRHPFVQGLGSGALEEPLIRFYLIQGNLYMQQYVKTFAMALIRADSEEKMLTIATLLHSILSRRPVHKEYMFSRGVTKEELEKAEMSLYVRAYVAHLHNVGQNGTLAEILAALLPCYWIYNEYAARLLQDYADTMAQNPHRGFLEMYTTDRYAASFAFLFDMIDEACANASEEQLRKVERAFSTSLEFEYLYWEMAYHQKMSL